MKDEIIKFETAKLAKEKGVNRKTFGFKESSVKRDYYNHKGELNGDAIERIKELVRGDRNDLELIAAPTQSLLQRWLREEHKISAEPVTQYDVYNHRYFTFKHSQNRQEIYLSDDFEDGIFKTYELALEKVLLEALKLIKP